MLLESFKAVIVVVSCLCDLNLKKCLGLFLTLLAMYGNMFMFCFLIFFRKDLKAVQFSGVLQSPSFLWFCLPWKTKEVYVY